MRIGSIFSGIGGLELGLERAGLGTTVFHAETDPYCSRVLERHWPGVPNLGDVRNVAVYAPPFDLLAGGFPCQPVSQAGRGLAQRDPRWLWPEFEWIINIRRPSWVVAENVPGLRRRGLDIVLGGLADLGYDAEWIRLSAAAVGAPHLRERIFIVAYAGHNTARVFKESPGADSPIGDDEAVLAPGRRSFEGGTACWEVEPDVGRVAHGVPNGVDRLRALGNAIVPQCAEFVGRCILRHLESGGGAGVSGQCLEH